MSAVEIWITIIAMTIVTIATRTLMLVFGHRIPKGLLLTNRNLLVNFESLAALNLIKENDCFICLLPFYHVFPLMANLILPLLFGAALSFPSHLNTEDIFDCIDKTGVSILVAVPRIYALFLEKINGNLESLPLLKKAYLSCMLSIAYFLRTMAGVNLSKIILSRFHSKFGINFRFMISGGAKLDPTIAKSFFRLGFTILEGYGLTETSPVGKRLI